jgi:hypothetical protein
MHVFFLKKKGLSTRCKELRQNFSRGSREKGCSSGGIVVFERLPVKALNSLSLLALAILYEIHLLPQTLSMR